MRGIERTTQFKKDYKREKKGKYSEVLETVFAEVLVALVVRVAACFKNEVTHFRTYPDFPRFTHCLLL